MSDKNISYAELLPGVEYIKIHGLQRSGTNYISHLLDENFSKTKCLVNLGGWKHGFYAAPWFLGREVHVLMLAKNPYSWLVSLYRYWGPGKKLRIGPDLEGIPFDEFVRNRCYFERQRDIPFLYRASNPVQHWNNMNFHWMTIRTNDKKVFALTYESLVANPKQVLQNIQESFGLKRNQEEFLNCETTFSPSGEKTKPTDQKWDRKYYATNEYMSWYTQDLLDFVNDELDMDVMVKLGYEFIAEITE